jgi:hypothetical protein
MFALDVCQHQGARDAVEDISRGCATAPLLQPGVPGRADMGALGDLFPTQTERATPLGRETKRSGIELQSTVLKIRAE